MPPIEEPPTHPRDYALFNLVWAGLTAGLLAGTRRTGREAPPYSELPVIGLATFSVTKALGKEKVGRWVRAPLVEAEPDGTHHPRGKGMRYVAGELITCTRCLGSWSALGLVGLRVAQPREGKIVTSVLAAAALNDVLQAAFAYSTAKANETEAGADIARDRARVEHTRVGARG